MKALIQRVRSADVSVDGEVAGRIDHGLLVYVGIVPADGDVAVDWMAAKIAHLRVFTDDAGKLNRSVQDIQGGILVVPNFTLAGDASKGRRPSFDQAAPPEAAEPIHRQLIEALKAQGGNVAEGVFRAHMIVTSQADGPVNIVLDSPASR